jgi:hypothetical protein
MVHLYNISIDKVGNSKHNNTLLRYTSPKDGPPVFAVPGCTRFSAVQCIQTRPAIFCLSQMDMFYLLTVRSATGPVVSNY